MNSKQNSRGFTVVEALLILLIVGLVGVVGYKVYNTKNSTDKIANNTTSGSEQATVTDQVVPSTINSARDLEQAETALNQYGSANDDNQDLAELDAKLAAF